MFPAGARHLQDGSSALKSSPEYSIFKTLQFSTLFL